VGQGSTAGGISCQIENRAARTCAKVGSSPHHQVEASFPACPHAHRAGFESHVHAAVFEPPVAARSGGGAQGQHLGVAGGVVELLPSIAGTGHDETVADHHRPHRHLAALGSRLRLGQRLGHEGAV